MKYIILLADGMADEPLEELGGRTPMEVADKPHMDFLASCGQMGLARTVPAGMPPGSDTANMAVMGFDPKVYYSGRSPLEAVAMGVALREDDLCLRTNLVCLSEEEPYEDKKMIDFSSGEISTAEAAELIFALQPLMSEGLRLYCGISYRHCTVMAKGEKGAELTPPHDITGRPIKAYLPKGRYASELLSLQRTSYEILRKHPVNLQRVAEGKRPANSLWFWGVGTKPRFDSLEKLYGIRGGVVCAVDLIKGLGLCAGMQVPKVAGATGGMVTDYKAKAETALQLLEQGCDLVYIHVEAPDECSHHGSAEGKIAAIEAIDREILGRILEQMGDRDYRILLTPDHPTPICRMTHSSAPVPFVLYDSRRKTRGNRTYSEKTAADTGFFLPDGYRLMELLINDKV